VVTGSKAEALSPLKLLRRAIERWENEGGRIGRSKEAQSRTSLPRREPSRKNVLRRGGSVES
jgi:hypothetical protein